MTMSKAGSITAISKVLLEHLIPKIAEGEALLIGLSGAQGCGKTTATRQLQNVIGDDLVVLSLDDFYLTLRQRQKLAKSESPLFLTRGVPGTHDIEFLRRTIQELQTDNFDAPVTVPMFQKSIDDRLPEKSWRKISKKPRAIIVEGWCIGALAPTDFLTSSPINDLEISDVGNLWRAYQAESLENTYAKLWDMFDHFVHIRAQSFDAVKSWRTEQEASNLGVSLAELPSDRRKWVEKFIQHYERLTVSMIADTVRPGHVINIDNDRQLVSSLP